MDKECALKLLVHDGRGPGIRNMFVTKFRQQNKKNTMAFSHTHSSPPLLMALKNIKLQNYYRTNSIHSLCDIPYYFTLYFLKHISAHFMGPCNLIGVMRFQSRHTASTFRWPVKIPSKLLNIIQTHLLKYTVS